MCKSHPTATELYQIVQKQLPKVSLGTIYRNLELLSENKTIQKLEMNGSKTRYDSVTEPHHHARCTECNTISDLFEIPQDVVTDQHMSLENYDVRGYRIEFYGLCPNCQSN